MKINKISIIFIVLTTVCFFSLAAVANGCGCSLIPVEESKDTEEAGEADVGKEEEPPGEEDTPPEEEPEEEPPGEETPPEDELPEEEPPEEEQPDEGEPAEAPTLTLEIIEGPTYSASDGVCYYRVKAIVSGTPAPAVEFSRDDSNGAWGERIAQVNLEDLSDTYNLTVTAANSEGTATDSMNIIWGCEIPNNPPEISEITFMGNHYMGLEYTFSAAVADPDGDSVTYNWSVSGGSLANPDTNPVKWTMPNTSGNYDITVEVDDGKGGQDQKTESIEVLAFPSISLSQIPGGGNIVKDITINIQKMIVVGDIPSNNTIRGFLNFDISSLSGKEIISAEIKFNDFGDVGDPYSLIEKIWVESVYWGTDNIELGDYYISGTLLGEYDIPAFTCSGNKLIDALNQAIDNGHDRFQIRLRHKGFQTNNDGIQDSLAYGGNFHPIEFTATYMP
ncbi:PKD domain-containing protein [Candidatus Poribacteria bacterium]|nr:PKD domain-containing protein [Candidatus Poribacteria bacterium]